MTTATDTRDKTSYHHGNLRQALMDTALIHIRQAGAEKLSLRAVARDLGVSQSAIYRHFSDKNALLTAIVSQGFEMLGSAMKAAANDYHAEPVESLRRVGQTYIKFAYSHPETYRLMFGMRPHEMESEELKVSSTEGYCVLSEIIQAGIEQSLFLQMPEEQLSLSAWSFVHGVASLAIDGQITRNPVIQDGEINSGLIDNLCSIMMQGFLATKS